MRSAPLLLLSLIPCWVSAQGPYSALLVTGDTLVAKEYYFRGDTLGFPGAGKMARRDVVLFWTPKERWTFTYPDGGQERIKVRMTDPCAHAHVAKVRNGLRLIPFDSLSIPPAWKADTLIRSCYEDWLTRRLEAIEEEQAMEEERTRYKVQEGNGGVGIGQPNEVILRTGDTLVLKHDLYSKDGMLCCYGGGCVSERDVLLIRTVKGQFFFHPARKYKIRLRDPIPDMSPGSQGRLYANMLFATDLSWDDSMIPDPLRNDPEFLQAYRNEVTACIEAAQRAKSRRDGLSIVSGGLTYGVVGMAVHTAFIRTEDRPYWGTPMPPE